jgi:SAM-dependent MidA family methyltransferase
MSPLTSRPPLPHAGEGEQGGPAFERIRERARHEGRLTFAAFMAEALYGPKGYYTLRPRLGGASADYFTAPELHPAFGALLGRLAARVWSALGRPARFDVVEYGPGTGVLCRDLLEWANHEASDFGRALQYRLVETSEALRSVQRRTLFDAGLMDERVTWEEDLTPDPSPMRRGENQRSRSPSSGGRKACAPTAADPVGAQALRPPIVRSVSGLILANELVDALPVHLVAMRDGVLRERYVVLDGDRLAWREDVPSTPALPKYFEPLGVRPGDDCLAEVNLEGVDWMERTASTVNRGAMLVLDYGYSGPELYRPDRRLGTLLTYRGHTLGSDPLRHVGAQDITAHVDFTSLARAGERGGLETVGLISQAALLRRLGIDGYLRQLDRSSLAASDHDANRRALLALIDPTGLGRIQALLQTRALPGFDPFADGSLETTDEAPPPDDGWLPRLSPGQMRLPGPLEAEGFIDLEGQWRELVEGESDGEDGPEG